jgi:RNA polymerase sigma-70 factor (ECF subfamily)
MSEIHGSNPDDQTGIPPSKSAAGRSDLDPQWREVFEESTAGLRAFLRGRLGQDSDVDDCLQVVYVKMIESGRQVAPAARRAWLFRVAANESARLWRSRASTEKMWGRHGAEEAFTEDPSQHVILTETTQKLYQALRQLPEAWQEIVRLRIEENLTFQQIASQLDIPLGTALTRMRRALERLKSELDSDQDDNAKSTEE